MDQIEKMYYRLDKLCGGGTKTVGYMLKNMSLQIEEKTVKIYY